MKYDAFISSSSQDRVWVRDLANALKAQGVTVWYDETQIKPGELLLERLREGLDESRNIIFVLNKDAAKSNWVAFELGAALGTRKPIIPIVQQGLRPGELPVLIRSRKYVVRQDPSTTAQEIAQALKFKHEEPKHLSAVPNEASQ
ncbi:toll/interleukin-1 receptor domain-containing protein [candidate division KSB1 bacterium]|nr:toll/interleukin-1 receptor domain-containing protein [candidate division KSB1 bacterium]